MLKEWKLVSHVKAKSLVITMVFFLGFIFVADKPGNFFNPVDQFQPSRLQTLAKIVTQANDGYYFQIAPHVPMEAMWEDPGMGVALSLMAMARRIIYRTKRNIWPGEIIFIELMLIILVFFSPFLGVFGKLPDWFYPAIPAFMGISFLIQALYFTADQCWASTLGVLWTVTGLVAFHEVFGGNWKWLNQKIRVSLMVFAIGFGIGLLGLFRRSVALEGLICVGCFLVWDLLQLWRRNARSQGRIKFFSGIVLVLVLIGGAELPRALVRSMWMVRDSFTPMQDVPRNPRHPFWLPLYLGLGYTENQFGIKNADEIGKEHVDRAFSDIPYGSVEFEKALRTLFFRTIKEDPGLFFRNAYAKFRYLVKEVIGLYILLPLFFILVGILVWKEAWPIVFRGYVCVGVWAISPLVFDPLHRFSLSLYSGILLWGVLMCLFYLFELRGRPRIPIGFLKKKIRSSS